MDSAFERKRIQGEYAHAMKDEERPIYRVAAQLAII